MSRLLLLALGGMAHAGVVVNEAGPYGTPTISLCGEEDWIELHNNEATSTVDIEGMILADDKGHEDDDALTLGGDGDDGTTKCPESMAPGEYLLFCGDKGKVFSFQYLNTLAVIEYPTCGFDFGIKNGDEARLYSSDGTLTSTTDAIADTEEGVTYGLTTNGSTYGKLDLATPGGPNTGLVVNEAAGKGSDDDLCAGEDWIEVFNPLPYTFSLDGLVLSDDKGGADSDALALGAEGCPQSLASGEYMTVCGDEQDAHVSNGAGDTTAYTGCGFAFGMKDGDEAQLWHGSILLSTTGDMSGQVAGMSASLVHGAYATTSATPDSGNGFVIVNEISTAGNDDDDCAGEDWLELYNPTRFEATITDLVLTDDKGPSDKPLTLGALGTDGTTQCPQTVPAGGFLVVCKDTPAISFTPDGAKSTFATCGFDFKLGGDDTANLYSVSEDDAYTLISTSTPANDEGSDTITWGRKGYSESWASLTPTLGAANPMPAESSCVASADTVLKISEVADKEDDADLCEGEDWVELYNPSGSDECIRDLVLVDDKGHGHKDQLVLGSGDCPTSLKSGEFMLLCKDGDALVGTGASTPTKYSGCGMEFGIGGDDTIQLFFTRPNETHANLTYGELLDSSDGCCAGSNDKSYGIPPGSSDHIPMFVRTPGLPNIHSVIINEVASEGNAEDACEGEDWVELYNPLPEGFEIGGMVLHDDKGAGDDDALALGGTGTDDVQCPTTMASNSYLLLCSGGKATYSLSDGTTTDFAGCGFEFGIGGSDTVTLTKDDVVYDTTPNCCQGSVVQTYGRGTPSTAFTIMPRTAGIVNKLWTAVAPPPPSPDIPPAVFPDLVDSAVKINEIAATGNADDFCAGEDWIELWNPTEEAASLVGMMLVDDKGHGAADTLVLGAEGCPQSLPAGAFVVFCKYHEIENPDGVTRVYTASGEMSSEDTGCGFPFGVGDGDTINLYADSTDNTTLADTTPHCCTNSMDTSFGRNSADGTGAFYVMDTRTPGYTNLKSPPPSPPPPLPPTIPGAAVVTEHKTETVIEAAGDVSDYDDAAKSALAGKFATLAGVDASKVAVLVESASVRITVEITVASAGAASALATSLDSTLSSAAAASTFTGITVTSTPVSSTKEERVVLSAPPSSPASSTGLSDGALAVIICSAAAVVLAILVAGYCVYKQKVAFFVHQPSAKMGTSTPMEMRPDSPGRTAAGTEMGKMAAV